MFTFAANEIRGAKLTKMMISARVDEKLNEDLEKIAISTQRSKAFLITQAIERFVQQEAWLTEKISTAVKAADESDEYVTQEDMTAWLKTWGTANAQLEPKLSKRGKMNAA